MITSYFVLSSKQHMKRKSSFRDLGRPFTHSYKAEKNRDVIS